MSLKYRSFVGTVAFSFLLTSITFVPQDSFAAVKKSKKSRKTPIVISVIAKPVISPQKILQENPLNKLPAVDAKSAAWDLDKKSSLLKISGAEPTAGGVGGTDGSPATGGFGGFYLMEAFHPQYINPGSAQLPVSFKVGEYVGTQLNQFLAAGYTLEAYISNGSILGNNPWKSTLQNFIRVPLNSGVTTLDLSNQPQGVPIYIIFAGRSPVNHVITTSTMREVMLLNFPNNDPQSYVGIIGGAMERPEYKDLKEVIFPVTPQQSDDLDAGSIEFVAYHRATNRVAPLQWSDWTFANGKRREIKISFRNTGEPVQAPEYFEWEIHQVLASQAQRPQFMMTQKMQNFLNNGRITITSYGPRDSSGELYSKEILMSNCTNIRDGFEVKTYRCGGLLMPPAGRTDLLPNGPAVDVLVDLSSGENYARVSFSIHNSVVGAFSDTKYDDFYFTKMEMTAMTQAGTPVAGIYAYKWPIPGSTDTFEQYGTWGMSGNVARIDFIAPVNAGAKKHWLRKDQSHFVDGIYIALDPNSSDLNRANAASMNLPIMLTLNDDTYNPVSKNNYFKIPAQGPMGYADLRRVMSESQISSGMLGELNTIWNGAWGMVRLPENFAYFYGPSAGGTTGGGQIEFTSKAAVYVHNARNLAEINYAIRTLKAMSLAVFSRQLVSTLVKEDGTSNSLALMFDRGISPFKYFNGRLFWPHSPYEGIFSRSSSQSIRNRHIAHAAAATSSLTQYGTAYLGFDVYGPQDEEHNVRFTTPAKGAATLAIDLIRNLYDKWGNAYMVSYYVAPNNGWGFSNSSALNTIIESTPQNLGLSAMGRSGEFMAMPIKALSLKRNPTSTEKNEFIRKMADLMRKALRPDGLMGKGTNYDSRHMSPSVYSTYQQLAAGFWGGTASQYTGGDVVVQWEGMLLSASVRDLIALYEDHPDPILSADASDIKDTLARFTRALHNQNAVYNRFQLTPAWTIMHDMINTSNSVRYSFYPLNANTMIDNSYVYGGITQYWKEAAAGGLLYLSLVDRINVLSAFPSEFFDWNALARDPQGISLLWVSQTQGFAP